MPEIYLDLNRDRIRSVLSETYRICAEQLNVEFKETLEGFTSRVEPYLESNRVSIPVRIPLPSRSFPELIIEVDLRRQKVFARMGSRKRQARLNHYLKLL